MVSLGPKPWRTRRVLDRRIERTLTYEYLAKQYRFMCDCDEVRHPAYIGGFGSGKSHVLCLQALRLIMRPKSYGLIGAPTYRLLTDTTMRKFWELCPPNWIRTFHKSEYKVTFVNNAEIIFRSLDAPGRLTNLGLDWFGLDEIGEVKLDTFRMLQGRLRRPGGVHLGYSVGNPAGPTHWSYNYFVIKARKFPGTYRLTQAPSFENTFLGKKYTETMRESYDENSTYYKRFVLGQFVAFEGAFWGEFSIEPYPQGHIIEMEQIPKMLDPQVQWRFGKVIDFGFEHMFACLWFVTDGQRIIFFDEYCDQHNIIRRRCEIINQREKMHQTWLGPHSYEANYTDHDAQDRAEFGNAIDENGKFIGFPCTLADKAVFKSILLVQTLISQGRFYITDKCEITKLQIPSYRAKEREKSRKDEPIKEDDDTCDCVRMACMMEMAHITPFTRAYDAERILVADPYETLGARTLDTFEPLPSLD